MKIAICDDEKKLRKDLRSLIEIQMDLSGGDYYDAFDGYLDELYTYFQAYADGKPIDGYRDDYTGPGSYEPGTRDDVVHYPDYEPSYDSGYVFYPAQIGVSLLVTFLSDYIVVGTLTTVVVGPVWIGFTQSWVSAGIMLAVTAVIFYKHRENLHRIFHGGEVGLRSTLKGEHRLPKN